MLNQLLLISIDKENYQESAAFQVSMLKIEISFLVSVI
jgi:hypothetical protein